MRSGFALRPFPARNAISVQDFYPTLVKREDARSGCATSSFNFCLKPKDASRNYPDCHFEWNEKSQTQEEEKNTEHCLSQLSMKILHCAALRSERQQKGKVLQEKMRNLKPKNHNTLSRVTNYPSQKKVQTLPDRKGRLINICR